MDQAKSQFRGRLEHIVRHRKTQENTARQALAQVRHQVCAEVPARRNQGWKVHDLRGAKSPLQKQDQGPDRTNSATKAGNVYPTRLCDIRPCYVREFQASGIWRSDVRGLHDARKRPSTSAQLHQPSSPAMNRQQRRDRFIPAKSTHQSGNTPAM